MITEARNAVRDRIMVSLRSRASEMRDEGGVSECESSINSRTLHSMIERSFHGFPKSYSGQLAKFNEIVTNFPIASSPGTKLEKLGDVGRSEGVWG